MNAFEEWLKTDCGKKCADFSTLNATEYLNNRLYHAFSAGLIFEYNQTKGLQLTIDWYEEKKRESDKLIKELRAKVASLEKDLAQPQQEPTLSPDV